MTRDRGYAEHILMPVKLSDVLKDADKSSRVDSTVSEYEEHFKSAEFGGLDDEKSQHKTINNLYYDLVTDFLSTGGAGRFTLRQECPARASRRR
jgi:hypothetical protein